MKITLGSLVLCKILMVNPVAETPRSDGLKTYEPAISTSTNMTAARLAGKDLQSLNSTADKTKNDIPDGYQESFITGVVEEIQSVRKLVEVEKNKKFEYRDFHTYVIKTENLEKLLIGSDACALATNVIVEDKKDIPSEELKDEVKETSPKKVQKKSNPVEKKITTESDIDLSEYEVVTDKETLKKYSEYIDQHKLDYAKGQNNIKIIDTNSGKISTVPEKKIEPTEEELKKIAQEVINFNDTKSEVQSDIIGKLPETKPVEVAGLESEKKQDSSIEVIEDMSLFDFFESKKRQEKELAKKEDSKIASKTIKKEVEVVKKVEPAKAKVYDRNTSVVMEAIKLVFLNI